MSGNGPIRVVLVEDNQVFREALELLLGLQQDIEVVASVADGSDAVPACREHRPDVVVMDYRLPGLDGVEATKAVLAQLPGHGGRRADRVGDSARDGRARGRGRGRVPDEGPGAGRDRRRDQVGGRPDGADCVRTPRSCSTPRPTSRRPRSGFRTGASCRSTSASATRATATTSSSGRTSSTSACARRTTPPTTSQPTPGDFAATYAELADYERIFSIHIPRVALGHDAERAGRRRGARRQGADDRLRDGVGRDRDARVRDPAPARARDDRRGDRRARRDVQVARDSSSSRSTRSSTSSAADGSAARRSSPASC